MQTLPITYLCFAFACLFTVSEQNSPPYFTSSTPYQGCSMTQLANATLGLRQVYYLSNMNYGRVQQPDCSSYEMSYDNCMAKVSQSSKPALFVFDASPYPYEDYVYIRLANENGSYVMVDRKPVELKVYGDATYSRTSVVFSQSWGEPYYNDLVYGKPTGSNSASCFLIFRHSSMALSVTLYQYDSQNRVYQLIQDYKSSYDQEQQWFFEPATTTDMQFDTLDQNGDGDITFEEYLNATNSATFANRSSTFAKVDENKDGFITRDEEKDYEKKMADETKKNRTIVLQGYIKEYDYNNDTKMQLDDVSVFLAVHCNLITRDSFATSFAKYDKNKDQALNITEFDNLYVNLRYEAHNFMVWTLDRDDMPDYQKNHYNYATAD